MRGRLLVVWLSVTMTAFTAPLAAQQQAKSASTSDPNTPQEQRETAEAQDDGRLKRMPGWLRAFASPDRKEGLSVNAGIIIAGSSLSGGVGYRRLNVFKTLDYEVEGNLSVRGYQDYRAAFGWLDARQSTLELDVADRKVASLFNTTARKSPGSALYLDLRYRDYPRHTYYGAGIDAREEDKADYALHGLSVEGVWQWQLTPALGVSARGGWLDLEVGPGHNDALINVEDRFAPPVTPGASEQPLYFTYGAGVVHDSRLEPGAPENGHLLGMAIRRYSASDTSFLSFTRVTFDARAYRHLSERGVLAVRGLVSSDLSGEAGATPFYLQQSLGGGETLRGFHSYRFPDRALAHMSVEYRWRAHRFVEIAPFLDTGTVAPALSALSLGSFKMSPGVGIRGRTSRRIIGRLDWAWSSEGQRISLGIGPSF